MQDALPEISFSDAADLFCRLRMVKSDAEIAVITKACEIQDAIFEKTFKAVRAGMSTRDIKRLFQLNIIKSDADFGWVVVCVGDFNPRQAAGSSPPDLRLEENDLLWVDLGIVLQGYHTDYCRGMVPGGASPAQLDKWGRIHEILRAGVEATRPGIPVSDLFRVQVETAEKLNVDMSTWPARRFGHGSGLHTTEPPYINRDDDTLLEPGMILHIEPGCIEKDGIYVLEHQVVVTKSGCTILSRTPCGLF